MKTIRTHNHARSTKRARTPVLNIFIKIGTKIYEFRRLPAPNDQSEALGLIDTTGHDSQVCVFAFRSGVASCTCDHCSAFGECQHVDAIRRVSQTVGCRPLTRDQKLFSSESDDAEIGVEDAVLATAS